MHDPHKSFDRLNRSIIACRQCPRLIAHCRKTAREKRAAYRNDTYFGRPVPNFGDPNGRVLIVGLAPAAHGANRTGRMFTGDRSGDFLFAALHRTGFASQPTATSADDGLTLSDVLITAACHCAPPANKPTRGELANCANWLSQTFDLMSRLRVVLCLGGIAFDAMLRYYQARDWIDQRAPYRFGHGAAYTFDTGPMLLGAYHPSQQNTFTGRLTEPMLDDVLRQARLAASRRRR